MTPSRGKRCPHCGHVFKSPLGFYWEYEDTPHTDPFECIRALSEQIKTIAQTLEDHRL